MSWDSLHGDEHLEAEAPSRGHGFPTPATPDEEERGVGQGWSVQNVQHGLLVTEMNQEILRGVPKNDEVIGLDMVPGLESCGLRGAPSGSEGGGVGGGVGGGEGF